MSTFLEEQGVRLLEGYDASHLDPEPDLCVVGNAVSRGNPEVEEILNRKLYYQSLPEAMKEHFLRRSHNLVVTGTHGKTTTTSLLAWILDQAGLEPGFLVGGLPANFGRGCRAGGGRYWVLEGDEYDTAFFDKRSKFLHYCPELAIINNVEFDHADIFASLEASFRRLVSVVPSQGMVLVNADDPDAVAVTRASPAPITEVGFSQNAAVRVGGVRSSREGVRFDLLGREFFLPMHGEFNVRNAAMAATAAHFYQVPLDTIAAAMAGFRGVRRRQEVRAEIGGVTVIDDFGHHPTAIRETLKSFRARFPGSRLWALFEPRSNTTRRRVFQEALPQALALADGVFVARVDRLEDLPPEQRLDPERLVADVAAAGRRAFYEPDAAGIVAKAVPLLGPGDIVIVFSNGGFGGIHKRLEEALTARFIGT
jgi:UDP-N-acetylmuramate: L-alanyl-gamma-D-glutamyl-meso-diaminopimelate ligase